MASSVCRNCELDPVDCMCCFETELPPSPRPEDRKPFSFDSKRIAGPGLVTDEWVTSLLWPRGLYGLETVLDLPEPITPKSYWLRSGDDAYLVVFGPDSLYGLVLAVGKCAWLVSCTSATTWHARKAFPLYIDTTTSSHPMITYS